MLFLFTDDQRADTIGALGNPLIQTPNLDRLAGSGFVFSNAYCMGGNQPAVCLPSRTMLLSGRSLFHLEQATAERPVSPAPSTRPAMHYHHGKLGNTPHAIQTNFQTNKYLANDQQERSSGYPGKEIADAAVEFLGTRPRTGPASCTWPSPTRTTRALSTANTAIVMTSRRCRCRHSPAAPPVQ